MKILFVSPYTPVPPMYGAATRIYHLLKALSENHEVTLVFNGSEQEKQILELEFPCLQEVIVTPFPRRYYYRRLWQLASIFQVRSFYYSYVYNKSMQDVLLDLTSGNRFDLIHTEFPMMALYEVNGSAPRVLDAHNVEFLNFKRMYQKAQFSLRKWFYYREYKYASTKEVSICKTQNAILTTSEVDKKELKKSVNNVPMHVIPNGVDGRYFAPFDEPGEPNSLVFTGMMGYLPNDDGMLYFLQNIYPILQKKIPDLTIYIVGMSPTRELLSYRSDNIIVTGKVDDVRPWVQKASAYIVPLRMGSGTRLKVLEALAMKKPVITTTLGCEGIDVKHNDSVLIADTPDDFADATLRVLRDKQLRNRLIQNGYQLVQEKYEWSVVGESLIKVYNKFEGDRQSRVTTVWKEQTDLL